MSPAGESRRRMAEPSNVNEGGIKIIETPQTKRTRRDSAPVLQRHQDEVNVMSLRGEGRKPEKTGGRTLRTHAEGLRSVEGGKVFLGEDGAIHLRFDFTGVDVNLADTMRDWCKWLNDHGRKPRVVVSIVSEKSIGASSVFGVLGQVAAQVNMHRVKVVEP